MIIGIFRCDGIGLLLIVNDDLDTLLLRVLFHHTSMGRDAYRLLAVEVEARAISLA